MGNDTQTQEKPLETPKECEKGYAEEIWSIPIDLLTTKQKAWMLRTNKPRAFRHFVLPAAREGTKRAAERRKQVKYSKSSPVSVMPDSLKNIDNLTKSLLETIKSKMNDANVLDLAKTLDILSDVKSKALKDSMDLQARNYTPTVITESRPDKEAEQTTEPIEIDRPVISETQETPDNTINIDTANTVN